MADLETLRTRARTMRRAPTPAEAALWKLVRDRRLSGLKFRRQVPLGAYIADIVCFDRMLVVEADGSVHRGGQYDADRDAWFEAKGFTVLRFRNEEIMAENPEPVFAQILEVRPIR